MLPLIGKPASGEIRLCLMLTDAFHGDGRTWGWAIADG